MEDGEDEFEKFWRRMREMERRLMRFIEEEQARVLREFEETRKSFMPSWSYEGFLRPLSTVRDEGDEYVIYVDMPEMDRGTLEVRFKDNLIFLKAKLKRVHRFSDWSGRGGETEFREYKDVISLPIKVDPKLVSVKCRKGVIEIRIKKSGQGCRA